MHYTETKQTLFGHMILISTVLESVYYTYRGEEWLLFIN